MLSKERSLKNSTSCSSSSSSSATILKQKDNITEKPRDTPVDHSPHLHDGAHAVVGADPHDLAVTTVEDGERRTHPLPLVAGSIDGLVFGFALLSVSVFTENR